MTRRSLLKATRSHTTWLVEGEKISVEKGTFRTRHGIHVVHDYGNWHGVHGVHCGWAYPFKVADIMLSVNLLFGTGTVTHYVLGQAFQ
jgi:hypothetical protein